MPTEPANDSNAWDRPMREDEATPEASEQEVLEETVRMAREGRKQLDADPNEPKQHDERGDRGE